jgi:hypothetical protein
MMNPDWDPETAGQNAHALGEDPPLMDNNQVAKIPYHKTKLIIFVDHHAKVGLSAQNAPGEYTTTDLRTGLNVTCLCSSRHRLWDPTKRPFTYLKVMHESARLTKLTSPYPWCEYILLSHREVDQTLLSNLNSGGPFRYGDLPLDIAMSKKYASTRFSETQRRNVHFNTNNTLNLACRYAFEFNTMHFQGMYPEERMFLHTDDVGMISVVDERLDRALGFTRVGENVAEVRSHCKRI